jgi:selenocysteine lyase/cysteine desulfurase
MFPAAHGMFAERHTPYLDTAGYGLPPTATVEVLREALDTWQGGTANWIKDWDSAGDRCRVLAAAQLGTVSDNVALLPAVSVGVGLALSHLGAGDEILLPDDEFASVMLPALAAADAHGVHIRRVSFEDLAASIRPETTLVATSHVRSNDGRVQNLSALVSRAKAVGARTLVDATHSAGVLAIDTDTLGIDVVVAAAYKHLLCPRGVAVMSVAPDLLQSLNPWLASWRSAAEPYAHFYGGSLAVLADTAARLDVSLAWHAWVGAEQSLEFLSRIPIEERSRWCVGLADHLADRLGVSRTGSSILAVRVKRESEARRGLSNHGIVASGTNGLIRLSFHLYNDVEDADAAAAALEEFVDHSGEIDRPGSNLIESVLDSVIRRESHAIGEGK